MFPSQKPLLIFKLTCLLSHLALVVSCWSDASGNVESALTRAAKPTSLSITLDSIGKPFLTDVLLENGSWTLTPSISIDGKYMVFARWQNPVFSGPDSNIQQLHLSVKQANGAWSTPKVVPAFVQARVDYPHFSPDGKWLYLSSTRRHPGQYNYPKVQYEDFDLWRVPLDKGSIDWEAAELVPCADCIRAKTPSNWNIRYVNNETSPRIDLMGNMYYWTERSGTGGWRDVYLAPIMDDGTFGPEQRLPINTPQRESGVAISRDGNTLIFASEGMTNAQSSDLFMVRRTSTGWSTPTSVPGVNTRYSESSPELVGDTLLLYTSNAPVDGYRGVDAGEGE